MRALPAAGRLGRGVTAPRVRALPAAGRLGREVTVPRVWALPAASWPPQEGTYDSLYVYLIENAPMWAG